MLDESHYEALRQRPKGNAVMYQKWRDLLFLHSSFEPSVVQALMPAGLTIDTFRGANGEERAWVGLVPFRMEGIRPRGLPALPWLSAFPETNVRTYVHRDGHEPGVWFFSLDAARWLACRYARAAFRLPYFHARMQTSREEARVSYSSVRLERPLAKLSVRAKVETPIPPPMPGSFEFFLIERYLLYSERNGKLFTGRVYHRPYPLCSADVLLSEETLVKTLGLEVDPWEHVCFSPGVDVEVFGIEAVC